MQIEITPRDDVTIVHFPDKLTIFRTDVQLREAFARELAAGRRRFVFDFLGTRFADSANIAEVISCKEQAQEAGGAVKLVLTPDGKIGEILRLTALTHAFETYPDVDAAVASFGVRTD